MRFWPFGSTTAIRLRRLRGYQRRYGMVRGTAMALAVWRASRELQGDTGRLIPIRVPGLAAPICLRPGTSDAAVLHQWFGGRAWEFGVRAREGAQWIIDAGANIGISSIYLSGRFPAARVIALELDESNYRLLRRNTEAFPNIVALHRGLWWRPARLVVANPLANKWSYRAAEVDGKPSPGEVEGVTIGQLLAEYCCGDVDLLKIDIEGGERELFQYPIDDWIGAIKVIAVELHERYAPRCTRAVRDALLSRGFIESVEGEYRIYSREAAGDRGGKANTCK